jgi:hypothetical protein
MNISNQAISTYSGYNFNSIADFNGVLLGATPTGIHVLGGTDDNGTDIDADIKTGSMDFGDTVIKYLRDMWATFRATGILKFTISINEDATTEVEKSTTLTGTTIVEERIKVPRGLRGRFFTVEIENVDGADFDIDSLSMLVEAIRRKVR